MTAAPTVRAVLDRDDGELAGAVAAQQRAPDAAGGFDEPASGTHWVWLLDGTALPRPDSLAKLLAGAERLEAVASPVVLASRVVASDGRLAPAHVPVAPQGSSSLAIRTATLRVLPVRAVTGASTLIRAAAISRLPKPGVTSTVAWTARLLRDRDPAFLVPESVADDRPSRHPRGSERARLTTRLLLGSALRPGERLRLAAELVERAAANR